MKSFLAWLTSWLVRIPGFTLRLTIDDRGKIFNHPDHPPIIAAFWHNRVALMPIFYERFCRGRTALVFISRSRDGQFVTEVVSHFGLKAVRGSSSKYGTSAALAAVKASEDPHVDITITPDGPRGPRYQIQPGLIRLARLTKRPIVAVTYKLGWKYELKSWDKFQIPFPFSTCHLVTSEPIFVPDDGTDAEVAKMVERITEALGRD